MVFHRVARWEEHHDFLVSIFLKEGEQHKETLLWRNHNVSLCCKEYGLLRLCIGLRMDYSFFCLEVQTKFFFLKKHRLLPSIIALHVHALPTHPQVFFFYMCVHVPQFVPHLAFVMYYNTVMKISIAIWSCFLLHCNHFWYWYYVIFRGLLLLILIIIL